MQIKSKKYLILFLIIIVISFTLYTPKNYIKYVFYNMGQENNNIISYLNNEDIRKLNQIYDFASINDYSKPQLIIQNKKNNEYIVKLVFDLYSKEDTNFGEQIASYNVTLRLFLERKYLFKYKISDIEILNENLEKLKE